MRYIIISLLLYWVFSSSIFAQTVYYVSPSGNDANPGTSSAPFQTIQHCVDLWNDTTHISCRCAGTFHEEVVITRGGPTPSEKNQLIAWDTDMDGSLEDETFILDGEGTRNIGIAVHQGPTKPDNIEIGHLTIENFEPDGGCGDGGELHFIKIRCSGGAGCDNYWIHDCTFRNLGGECNVSGSYIAIRVTNTDNMLIENNTFNNFGGFLLRYFDGSSNVIYRNNYAELKAEGIKVWGIETDSIQIYNNTFDCDGNGHNDSITLASGACGPQNAVNFSNDVQHSVIRNNVFNDCISAISMGSSETFGSRDNAHNLIENNLITRSPNICNIYAAAITLSDCSTPSINTGDSVELRDLIIRNNVIRFVDGTEQGSAIFMQSGHLQSFENNFEIYNNTIMGYRLGIRIDQCSGYPYHLNNITLMNNIFTNIHDAYYNIGTFGTWVGPMPHNFVSDYNSFDFNNRFEWDAVMNFATWQTMTGNDANSRHCTPTFDAVDDYHLSATDTCVINQGTAIVGVETDRDGDFRPAGGGWDMGADEYVAPLFIADSRSTDLVSIYPNPSQGAFTLEWNREKGEEVRYEMINLLGEVCLTGKFLADAAKSAVQIDAMGVVKGGYIVKVWTGNEVFTRKIILR